LTCIDVNIAAGELDGSGQDITLSGDWTNSGGTFTHANSTVVLDTANDAAINGNNTFFNLTCQGAQVAGKTLTFEANKTQNIDGKLTLNNGGAANNRILLRSSVDGTYWHINPGTNKATDQDIFGVDVKDSSNDNGEYIDSLYSTDREHNENWFTPKSPPKDPPDPDINKEYISNPWLDFQFLMQGDTVVFGTDFINMDGIVVGKYTEDDADSEDATKIKGGETSEKVVEIS